MDCIPAWQRRHRLVRESRQLGLDGDIAPELPQRARTLRQITLRDRLLTAIGAARMTTAELDEWKRLADAIVMSSSVVVKPERPRPSLLKGA